MKGLSLVPAPPPWAHGHGGGGGGGAAGLSIGLIVPWGTAALAGRARSASRTRSPRRRACRRRRSTRRGPPCRRAPSRLAGRGGATVPITTKAGGGTVAGRTKLSDDARGARRRRDGPGFRLALRFRERPRHRLRDRPPRARSRPGRLSASVTRTPGRPDVPEA